MCVLRPPLQSTQAAEKRNSPTPRGRREQKRNRIRRPAPPLPARSCSLSKALPVRARHQSILTPGSSGASQTLQPHDKMEAHNLPPKLLTIPSLLKKHRLLCVLPNDLCTLCPRGLSTRLSAPLIVTITLLLASPSPTGSRRQPPSLPSPNCDVPYLQRPLGAPSKPGSCFIPPPTGFAKTKTQFISGGCPGLWGCGPAPAACALTGD